MAEHGDARTRQDFIDTDGFRLGQWVGARRLAHAKGKLDPMRTAPACRRCRGGCGTRRQLRVVDAGYNALVASRRAREGHMRVPAWYHVEAGMERGTWINNAKPSAEGAARCRLTKPNASRTIPGWRWFA